MKVRKETKFIVIHCSDTPASMRVDVKDLDRWHRERGFLKVGYHYIITRDGVLQTGRNLDECGAHVAGHNHHSVGVVLIGGRAAKGKAPEDNFEPAQWEVMKLILKDLKNFWPDAQIVGHRDLDPAKACPSFDVSAWLQANPI